MYIMCGCGKSPTATAVTAVVERGITGNYGYGTKIEQTEQNRR